MWPGSIDIGTILDEGIDSFWDPGGLVPADLVGQPMVQKITQSNKLTQDCLSCIKSANQSLCRLSLNMSLLLNINLRSVWAVRKIEKELNKGFGF